MDVRQRVADLNFYLFEGIVHPELFAIHHGRSFQREDFRADVWLVDSGHVVSVGNPRGGITEIVCPSREDLPWHRLLHTVPIGRRREDTFSCLGAFVYHTSYSREALPKSLFEAEYAAYLSRGGADRLVVQFETGADQDLDPFVLLEVEAVNRHLSVQAVHAFPDERTLVKVQSLIEMRHARQ